MRVFATAGHVDHGKSTLVLALTGVDPDRWAEEKARGMTIDLGFAVMTLDSGEEVAFIDVPGHSRFVKNMLAGVGGVDACVFVVAATEGWKPQSEEHLRILEFLGISHGLVVLTKVGLVDAELRELAASELREHLAGSILASAEVVLVDVPAGIGLDRLRDALEHLVAETPAGLDRGRPRLWIDRSFAMRGAGTVVTGTLTGGSVSVGDEMTIQPGDRRVRVRGLQSHHAALAEAGPGRRLAVNVVGVSHQEVKRGQALVRPGQWHVGGVFDASLSLLATVPEPLGGRGAFIVHVGSAALSAHLRVLGPRVAIEPGNGGSVRFWLNGGAQLPLVPGDRYVLREAGRGETIGGGEILDVEPVLRARIAAPSLSVERVVSERGWVDVEELSRLTGSERAPTVGHWVVDPTVLEAHAAAIREACHAAGSPGLSIARFDERERAVLARGVPGITVDGGRVLDEAFVTDEMSDRALAVLAILEAAPLSPPDLSLDDRGALRELERRGLVVHAGECWFASSAIDGAVAALVVLLGSSPDGFTVAAARDALGITRKHAIPLLSHLDRVGVTRRRGDLRIAGPRIADRVPST